jgi:hypothetical protein
LVSVLILNSLSSVLPVNGWLNRMKLMFSVVDNAASEVVFAEKTGPPTTEKTQKKASIEKG